jgi:putative transcriptional regulator
MSPTNPRPSRPNRLREFREGAGLTQQDLADKVDAGRVTIIRAEQGSQAPSLELADRLADVLDTTIDELFSGSDRETLEEAYTRGLARGRLAEREDQERAQRVEPDTADADRFEVAAFVEAAVRANPSAADRWQVWQLRNPRGTKRKLDAVVVVQVLRRPPRAANRLWEQIRRDLRVGPDTETR